MIVYRRDMRIYTRKTRRGWPSEVRPYKNKASMGVYKGKINAQCGRIHSTDMRTKDGA